VQSAAGLWRGWAAYANRRQLEWGYVVGVLLVAGTFLAVVLSYVCTEYQLVRLHVWQRLMSGRGHPLLTMIGANAISFAAIWLTAVLVVFVSGTPLYAEVTAICACAQALWLGQNLWSYHRNRPRLRYEN
jgi:hypothetical protein